MITILDSIVNIMGLFDHLVSTRIFTLILRKNFIRALKIMRKRATATIWNC